MRVLLSRRDERGAIAFIVASLMVGLCIMSAFVVDYGRVYVDKNEAQTTADAAVLAAAKVYQGQTEDCATVLATKPALRTDAQHAAESLRVQNMPNSRGLNFDVHCTALGELEVTYDVEYDSPIGIGQLVTDSDHMTVSRTAAATFDRPVRGDGMRPWPICSNSVPDTLTHDVVQVTAGNKDNKQCPGMDLSGNWFRFACPGFKNGSANDTGAWIEAGCPNPASPVPNQPTDGNPSTLWSHLVTYPDCQGKKASQSNEFCLTRDTGNAQNKKMVESWQKAIDQGILMEIPIFCATPACSADAVTSGGVLPIYKIAVIRLCGVNLDGDKKSDPRWPTGPSEAGRQAGLTTFPPGPCTTNNPMNYRSDSETNDVSAFYVIFERVIGGFDSGTDGSSSNLRLTK
jgi:Flp pilus assembly protein TadG